MTLISKAHSIFVFACFTFFCEPGLSIGNLKTQTQDDFHFRELEREAINCFYPELVETQHLDAQWNGVSEKAKKAAFSLSTTDQAHCPQRIRELAQNFSQQSLAEMYSQKDNKFPFYRFVAQSFANVPAYREALYELNFPVVLHGKGRSKSRPISVPSAHIEGYLRDLLHVKSFPKQAVTESSTKNCQGSSHAYGRTASEAQQLYSLLTWKHYLHQLGYDCTVDLYYRASHLKNLQKLTGSDPQRIFEKRSAAINVANRNLELQRRKQFKQALSPNDVLVFFPPLAYDVPSKRPREQLTVNEWKKGNFYSPSLKQRFETGYFEKDAQGRRTFRDPLGLKFELVERVTLAPLNDPINGQVATSKQSFLKILEKHLRKNPHARFIVFGRSMGALVAREVLEKTRRDQVLGQSVESLVSAVVFVGGTPFGSVIADYKSRSDLHDENYQDLNSFVAKALVIFSNFVNWFGVKQGHLVSLLKAGRVRANVEALSHQNFDPSRHTNTEYRVLNVILLKPSLANYFLGSEKSESSDPVFLHWSMYGPTEGSSPLSHAAWDTHRSTRVFYKSHNHLAFWNLNAEQGLQLMLASILTAKDLARRPRT